MLTGNDTVRFPDPPTASLDALFRFSECRIGLWLLRTNPPPPRPLAGRSWCRWTRALQPDGGALARSSEEARAVGASTEADARMIAVTFLHYTCGAKACRRHSTLNGCGAPIRQCPLLRFECGTEFGIGGASRLLPPTPPYIRVRIRRFAGLSADGVSRRRQRFGQRFRRASFGPFKRCRPGFTLPIT